MGDTCVVCSAPAKHSCSACQKASYCGRDHQREHWKVHKVQCCPYKIMANQLVGRYLVASRDIQVREIVLFESPLAVGPDQVTPTVCLSCYKKVDGSYLCSRCHWPMCSPACEVNERHQGECKVFGQNQVKPNILPLNETNPDYECITTLRCLLLKRENPKKWDTLLKFMSHNEERKRTRPNTWTTNQENIVEFLRNKCCMDDFSEEEIHNVIGILDVNCFDLRGNGFSIRGVFPTACLMSHRCVPNTQFSNTDSLDIKVIATVPIKKGEEITDAYTTALNGTMVRRRLLREAWFFDCICDRCHDTTELGTYISALKCVSCEEGLVLSTEPTDENAVWKCDSCENTMQGLLVRNMTNGIKVEVDKCSLNPSKTEELIKVCESILHPCHYHMIYLKRQLIQMYGHLKGYELQTLSRPLLERKIQYCLEVLSVLRVVEPGKQKRRGMLLYELHGPLYFLASKKFDSGEIDKQEFLSQIHQAKRYLQEAIMLLKDERETSLEGYVGRSMEKSLAELDDLIFLVNSL